MHQPPKGGQRLLVSGACGAGFWYVLSHTINAFDNRRSRYEITILIKQEGAHTDPFLTGYLMLVEQPV